MTTTMNNNLPGRQRRSLNDSIGHLDQMIDGLSEAIPGTIRDTLQETVGAAITEGVRAALLEIVSNPDVLALLRNSLPTPPPLAVPITAVAAAAQPGVVHRLLASTGTGIVNTVRWSLSLMRAGVRTATQGAVTALNKLAELRDRLRSLRHARRPLLLAVAVGALVATITLLAPSWVAAMLSGLGGAGVTLAVQAGLWLRQHLGSLLVTSD
jgi:hypothetical protein